MVRSADYRKTFTEGCIKYAQNLGVSASLANRAYSSVTKSLKRLRNEEDKGEEFLRDLTVHGNPWIRVLASAFLLPIAEEFAKIRLEELSAELDSDPLLSTRLAGFEARQLLEQWALGRLRLHLMNGEVEIPPWQITP
jgi:hypothetical protein